MRTARKLTLLALTAMASMAFMASSASATDTVEVVNEKTGRHCQLSGPDKCTVHFVGIGELRVDLGIFGEAHEATCNVEILFHVGETGQKRVEVVIGTPGDANCATAAPACNLPWAASGEEDGPVGVVQSNAAVCVDPAEGPVCQGNLAFNVTEQAGEHYEANFSNSSVGLCEVDVDIEGESSVSSNAELHINHP